MLGIESMLLLLLLLLLSGVIVTGGVLGPCISRSVCAVRSGPKTELKKIVTSALT